LPDAEFEKNLASLASTIRRKREFLIPETQSAFHPRAQ